MAAEYLNAVCAMLKSGKPHKTGTLSTDGKVIISYPGHKNGGIVIARWASEEEFTRIHHLQGLRPTTKRVLLVEAKDNRLLRTTLRQCSGIVAFFSGDEEVQVSRAELEDLSKGLAMADEVTLDRKTKAKKK